MTRAPLEEFFCGIKVIGYILRPNGSLLALTSAAGRSIFHAALRRPLTADSTPPAMRARFFVFLEIDLLRGQAGGLTSLIGQRVQSFLGVHERLYGSAALLILLRLLCRLTWNFGRCAGLSSGWTSSDPAVPRPTRTSRARLLRLTRL